LHGRYSTRDVVKLKSLHLCAMHRFAVFVDDHARDHAAGRQHDLDVLDDLIGGEGDRSPSLARSLLP
jgi:hypothetical protein